MNTPTAMDLWDVGCSIIPVQLDKRPAWAMLPQKFDETQKRMRGEWKPYQERRPNVDEMKRWAKATPPAFAIVTGEISGRITFDFDGELGVKLAEAWGIRPHRRTGSGGLHLDVVHPGWFVPTLNGKSKQELGRRWPGLDVKGDGGYVIAIGRNEKGVYEWLRDPEPDPIESVPAEVWGFLKQYSTAKESTNQPTNGAHANGKVKQPDFAAPRVSSEKLIERALSAAPSAGRNNAGFDLACQARDNGYSESETRGILQTFRNNAAATNTKGQFEPYSDQEITASLREAFNRSPRDPWKGTRGAPSYTYTHERDLTPPAGLGGNGEPSDNRSDGPIDLLPFLMNDQGNSERLRAFAGSGIRYCHDFKKWLIWDGARWTIDGQDQILRWAKAAMLEFLRQAADAKTEAAEKFARQSLDARRLGAMVHLTECELTLSPEELDTDPTLLNFRNGTVDLKTGILKPHSRADFITKAVECDYKPEARCSIFLASLHRLMGGGPDAGEGELQRAERLVSHLQKAFGYSATGITSEKVIFITYGGGNNGKTTMLTTIAKCLGEYSGVVLIDSIMSRQDSNNASADLADLRGARFVMTSETEEGQRLAEGKLKRITQGVSGGMIKACRKYENPIQFIETHKLWMDCNHKPLVRGTDAAIWSRIHLIPFTVTITADEIDRQLTAKLMAEAEGILAWIIQGAVRWHHEGLGKPPEVADAVNEYREEMDQIGRFIEECCVTGEFASTPGRRIYIAYKKWAEEAGEQFVSETAFGRKLKERGYGKRHGESGAMYSGIGLRA